MKNRTKFYEFNQNNSGGSFITTQDLAHRVIIEANSSNEADIIGENLGMYWDGCSTGNDCPCCGDRWYSGSEINIEEWKEKGYPANVYTHYKDYQKVWEDKFGQFERKEEPKLSKKYSVEEYGTNIFFRNIEEYAQFMANNYGWTTPDVIIHYLDGTKKNIYTTKEELV